MRVAATLGAVPVCDSIDVLLSACTTPSLKRKEKTTDINKNHKLFCHFTKLDIYRFLDMVAPQCVVFWIYVKEAFPLLSF